MNDVDANVDTPNRHRGDFVSLFIALVLIAALAAGGWYAWQWWQTWRTAQQNQTRQQFSALTQQLDTLRSNQQTQNTQLQEAATTARLLRDELFGLNQRNTSLRDSLTKLANATHQDGAALRINEAEVALQLAIQRINIANDVNGARQAYALAADALSDVTDTRFQTAKNTLEQERSALALLGQGPHAHVAEQLKNISDALQTLPQDAVTDDTSRPAWQRVLAPIIDIRRSDSAVAINPVQRTAFENAMQMEITLARAALERNDQQAFQEAIKRVENWIPRLWPASPQTNAIQEQLQEIATEPLQPHFPELGETLTQLRALRGAISTSSTLPTVKGGDTP